MSEIQHLDIASTKAEEAGCGCGCGTHSDTAASGGVATTAEPTSGTGFTTTFQVVGMTCGHCVNAVTGELTDSVAGVSAVNIDLPTGQVVLTSDGPVTEAAVSAAVTEAGYQLAPGSLH
jgi:copper chaperone